MSIIQKMLGLPAIEGAEIESASLRFAPLVTPVLLVVIAVVLALLAWAAYRKTPEDVSAGRRRIMWILRAVFFILLLGLLLRPVLQLDLQRERKRTLAVLIDASASMGIPDAGGATRAEAVQTLLADEELALLESLGEKAEIVRYSFGGSLANPDAALDPNFPETALGDALSEVLRRHSADDLGGVLLLTDGASNEGRSPLSAATSYRERGVRVLAHGVGSPNTSDISIEALDLPSVALAKDAVPVAVKIRHRGLAGARARVVVTLAGVRAGEQEIQLAGDGEDQEVVIPVLPNQPGEFEVEARVEIVGDDGTTEILSENNALAQTIRVLDSQIRVLMVESSPRWEFKYLQAMLTRERRVELECFLADVDPAVARTPGSPYIENFPERREDIFGYDLILFGDVDPDDLPDNAPENIASFVADGGGSLAILAGKQFTPGAYRNTEFERLLPVELAATRLGTAAASATRPIQLILTEAGEQAGFLGLEDEAEASVARWEKLPPIYWVSKAERAKPAAEVYLTNPLDGGPVVALQRYGAGEVLWVGTDNTWRWRKNTGDLYHTRFWGQVVQRMAGRRLVAGSRRTDIRSDRSVARSGERFTVFARLLDGEFQPRTEETIMATLEGRGDGAADFRQIALRAVPGSPGTYRAEFPAGDPGRYRLSIADDPAGGVDLAVRGADREMGQSAMDERTLRELAKLTNGAYLTTDDLPNLVEIAALEPAKVGIYREAELWNSPLYFILLLLPLAIEWFARKFNELK